MEVVPQHAELKIFPKKPPPNHALEPVQKTEITSNHVIGRLFMAA